VLLLLQLLTASCLASPQSMTAMMGHQFYSEGQSAACDCLAPAAAAARQKVALLAFYGRHNTTQLGKVAELLAKKKGKEGAMWNRLGELLVLAVVVVVVVVLGLVLVLVLHDLTLAPPSPRSDQVRGCGQDCAVGRPSGRAPGAVVGAI